MKVLIVDDSFPARAVLKSIVERLGGNEILEAPDGRKALEVLRAHAYEFDLVLLDWMLPHLPGIEVARELSGHPRGRRVPLVMVTAESDPARVAEAFYAGATNYVVKPFTPETIRRKIAEVTSLKHLEATAAIRTDGGIAGDIGAVALEEVVQYIQLGRRSGDLVVKDGARTARISFEAGEAWDAHLGPTRGEEAFFEILRSKHGRFELEPAKTPPQKRIETPTLHLLIEAMRRRDAAADRTPEG
jgi:two-component system chemotaxis response regulator CheY